ncbi:MAG: PqqD family peptide modification chaperone [Armatimonadota bacterium]
MDASSTPQRRHDLVLTPVSEEGRSLTVVHDPRTGKYFRIREVEGFILSLLDGVTPLAEVHGAVLREFPGVRLSQATVIAFAQRLHGLGWLEGSVPGLRRVAVPFYRRLLRIQLPPVPADGLFQALQPLARAAYHPAGIALIVLFLLYVGHWAFFSVEELARHSRPVLTPGGMVLLWTGFTVISIFHELGHGVTCRYFGARSHGVGFFVMYGIPCFYCDVSGAWTLSSRKERLLIGSAGLAWQLVFGALAFVLWKLLEPETVPARICHVMVGTCGFMALMNLNPFIKLDGYYLLSDWLRIPNLRDKAIRYFQGRVGSILVGTEPPRSNDARERRIFFWFGFGSWLYSAVLLTFLYYSLGRWLVGSYGREGAFVLGILTMAILSSWLKTMAGRVRARLAERKEKPLRPRLRPVLLLALLAGGGIWFWNARWTLAVASPCTLEAEARIPIRGAVEGVVQEIRLREGDRVRAGEVVAVLESYDLEKVTEQLRQKVDSVEAASRVVEQEAPLVAAEKERDVLEDLRDIRSAQAELSDRQELFPARQSEAERKVQEARAALDSAERVAERLRGDERAAAEGRLPPDAQAVVERIDRLRAQRDLAQKEVRRAAFLVREGALQSQRLDTLAADLKALEREEAALQSELRAKLKTLHEDREDAESEVRRLRAGYEAALESQRVVAQETRPERLDAIRDELDTRSAMLEARRVLRQAADVKRAEAAAKRLEARPLVTEIERVERKIRQTQVTAPISGVISSPRLHEKRGLKLNRGQTLAWIDRVETLTAKVLVDEKEMGEIRRGLPVQLRVGAYPDRLFEGHVTDVSPRPVKSNGRGAYEIRLQVENPEGDLRPGITGHAKIICGERPLREVAFRRVYRYIRTEVWTWF